MTPAPLHLVLIRHGLTDWNEAGRLLGRVDIGLNAAGRAQAEAVAKALHEVPLGAVLSSPQLRARETAAPIGRAHGLVAQIQPELDEVWLGRWQGKTFSQLTDDPDLRRYIEDPTYTCAAIEPATRVQERLVQLAERLRAGIENESQIIALVSHGDPIRVLLAHYLSIELRLYWRLLVRPGSVSILRLGAPAPRLCVLNWRPGTDMLPQLLRG